MISDIADVLNNNPEKKDDLVKFPTKLDFDSSRTIIETVKAMQSGDYRMIAAVVVDRMRFSLDFVYAETLEIVQGSIIRISENSMPQTAAELSSKLAGYCLAKDQKGNFHIDIADLSNVESCQPFKCEAKIFEQINVADCVPISFSQSSKPGPDPEQKEIWRQARQLTDGQELTIAKESIDGIEYNFVYKNTVGKTPEKNGRSIIFSKTPLFFKDIKSAAGLANDLKQYCIHRSVGSGDYDILLLGNGCEAQDKATKLSNCKVDDFAATTAQVCLPVIETQPLLWEQVHDLSVLSNVVVATINLNDQNLGIQYLRVSGDSSIGNGYIKLDRTAAQLQKIDNAAALSADLATVYIGDDDNGGVKICARKSDEGCYPPANIKCNSKLFNKVEVSSQCEQILTADHKFPIWERVQKLSPFEVKGETKVLTLIEKIDGWKFELQYSYSTTSKKNPITGDSINIGLANPVTITDADALHRDLEQYYIRRTKAGQGDYEFANYDDKGVTQLLPVGCEAKNFNKAFAQDCGVITTQLRLWESIAKLPSKETIQAAKIQISGQGYEVGYERELPDSGQEIDNTNFLITLYEVNMAQTAQQITTNINKRYVYYDTDGKLDIKSSSEGDYGQLNCDKGFAKLSCTGIEMKLRVFQKVNSKSVTKVATQEINGQSMQLNYQEGTTADQQISDNEITITDQASTEDL